MEEESDALDYRLPMADDKDEPYIFTTVRWDALLVTSAQNTAASCKHRCPVYMLEHHWTRLQIARWAYSLPSNTPADLLRTLSKEVQQWRVNHPEVDPWACLRIRSRIYPKGKTFSEIQVAPRVTLDRLFPSSFDLDPEAKLEIQWTVIVDTQSTRPSTATMYKTSDRRCYDRARKTAGISSVAQTMEVILYNPDHHVMDCSISTPYFFRNGQWIVPAACAGGLQGTSRRWALEQKLCVEGTVSVDSIQDGEVIWLSNGVKGFYPAIVRPCNNAPPLSNSSGD